MTLETLAIAGLETFATATWTVIGLVLVYLFIWLFAVFDALRDGNLLGLIVLILLPGFGLLIYLIFLNQPSGRRRTNG